MTKKIRVVIAGGGYGGLRAALKLRSFQGNDPSWDITLVDQHDYHLLSQLLHEAAAERVDFNEIFIPFREILDPAIRFKKARVTGLDREKKALITEEEEVISYDYLIIALGGETDFFDIPGLKEHSFTLKSLQDSININQHIHQCFQTASRLTSSRERTPWLTFVIGGGGFAGTQMAGELSDWLPRLAHTYGVPQEELWLVLVEATPHILRGFDPVLVQKGTQILQRKGVQVLVASPVAARDPQKVVLQDGREIPTQTLIWTGGVRGNSSLQELGLPLGPRHRVPVNPYLQLVDDPAVFVIGDSALIQDEHGHPLPPSAQYALQQADLTAANIRAAVRGQALVPYQPKIRGLAISIGRTEALASVGPHRFTGLNAVLFKQIIVLKYIFSLRNLNLIVHRAGTPVRALQPKPVRRRFFASAEAIPAHASRSMEFGRLDDPTGSSSVISPRHTFRLLKKKEGAPATRHPKGRE